MPPTPVEKLELRFDMNTIKHLGVLMYSRLPPVLAELVSNSWDADADEVTIVFDETDYENKKITFQDNGCGMTFEDVRNKFLQIGRNKRKDEGDIETLKYHRKPIGKKGIGKLSVFGIASRVIINTTKDSETTKFTLNLDKILEEKSGIHEPPFEKMVAGNSHGTNIELVGLKRKSSFSIEDIAKDLVKRFLVFDENFKVKLIYKTAVSPPSEKDLVNEMRFEGLNIEQTWEFPNDKLATKYPHATLVKGKIFTIGETTLPEGMKGIYLVARKKLVNAPEFYGAKISNTYAHAYMTGWLEVDFIDKSGPDDDYISTNRESLNWENEDCLALREYLKEIIQFVSSDWKKKRKEKKVVEVCEKVGTDIETWLDSIENPENKKLAKKITTAILENDSLSIEKSAELVEYTQKMMEYESFKDMARALDETDSGNICGLLDLLEKWKITEAREIYSLSKIRVETIVKFKKFIDENAREVPELHNFFSAFPWILDPRIMNFEDEVRYSELLRKHFPDSELPEQDRRLDFLCVDFANTYFIIEIKRPNKNISHKELDQAVRYKAFLEDQLGNEHGYSVETCIVCGGRVKTKEFDIKLKGLRTQGVYYKTYNQLLMTAENYHKELIKKFEEMKRGTAN